MKTPLIYVLALILIISASGKLSAQYSFQNARYLPFYNNYGPSMPLVYNHDSLPPLSSVLPAGPDYGVMAVNTRPLWYYFPSCISAPNRQIEYEAQNFVWPFTYPLINLSVAIWGPFDNFNNITLAQLDASKLIASFNGTTTAHSSNNPFIAQIPNLDTGKVFIFVVTSDDTISNQVGGFGMNLNFPGLSPYIYNNECNLCNGKASYFEKYLGACVLSVDTPGNHPHMIWRKDPADIGIAGYYVGRKNVMGTLDTLTYIDYATGLSEYTDSAVSAVQMKREYNIIPVDSCGQINTKNTGVPFGTLYLQSYPGLNNEVNLIWDYSGLLYITKSLIPIFYIWRSSGINTPVLIDSVGINWAAPLTKYYTDISAPAGPTKYSIEVRYTDPCFAMKTTSTYSSSYSNPSGVVVLAIQDAGELSSLTVSPNPVSHNEVKINFGQQLKDKADVYFISVDGKIVDKVNISKGTVNYYYSTANLNPGIYQVRIETRGYKKVMKLVVL